MYLPSASPLLQGDRDHAAREQCRSSRRRDDAALESVYGRLALWQTITSPSDLAQMFGAQLGANAQMMQDATAVSRQDAIMGTGDPASNAAAQTAATPTVQQLIASAPKSYSLNGQPSQVDGCKWAPAPQIVLPPSPSPTMPQLAPVVIQTPIGPASLNPGTQPKYSNLCWAIRNGLVTQDQFNLADFMKLSVKCYDLGYQGTCPPPADVTTWLIKQRQAGTLPHISVSDADLTAIPHAPDLQGLSCQQAMIAGGLTGYAPPWSDALVTDSQAQMGNPDMGVAGWIASHPWLSLAIAVGGAVVLSRRQR
jgi:hypothetical protein